MDWGQLERQIADFESQRRTVQRARRAKRRLMVYDTETDGFHNCADILCPKCWGQGRVPEPFLHGFYDGEEYVEFETVEEAVAYVETERVVVYAHNGGRYDYHPLRRYMNTDQPIQLINGRLSRFHIGEAEFRDSLNIFPGTRLADFGVKNEIDYQKMEPGVRDIPAVRREISLYLRQDCVGLYEQVERYRRQYGTNLTQAGSSMKYWEENYYHDKAPRQSKGQFDQCRPFYYGGRVQCFEQGVRVEEVEGADLNSAYPRAMLDEHPISPAPSESHRLPRGDEAIKTCLIQLQCTARGCFPWRDPQTHELYFPEDEGGNRKRMRRYQITGWEFLAALEHDAVSNIHIEKVLTFARTVSFAEYIGEHYSARLEADRRGDKAEKIYRKYFMNGVYGKFGADPSHYAEYAIVTTDSVVKYKAKGYREYQPWGEGKWLMEREPTLEELQDITSRWRYYNVATSASITGWVRAHLFKALMKTSGAVYCDTDSIVARDVKRLEFGDGLGQWKHEGHFDRWAIAGKKLYALHRKGAPLEYDPDVERWGPKGKDPSWKIASKGVAFHSMVDGPERIEVLARGEGARFSERGVSGEVTYRPMVPTYSVKRDEPRFINRSVRRTAKDIRLAPEHGLLS